MDRPVVLCPLATELASLSRSRVLRGSATMRCCGPGAEAVAACVQAMQCKPPLVVLAGVAGGLRATSLSPVIGHVVDRSGQRWSASCTLKETGELATVIGVEEPVTDIRSKHVLAESIGADLVDCESHAFARACEQAGLRWAIVRGVSDGPNESLPPQALRWIDSQGRVRLGALLLDLARRPWLAVRIAKLGTSSHKAMKQVACQLEKLLEQEGLVGAS